MLYLRLTHSVPVTVNDLESIANDIADSWGTRLTPRITSNVTLDRIDITFIPTAGESLQWSHSEVKTGADANVLADAASCYVLDWLISDYYRGGHPRSYLPGVPANQLTNGSDLGAVFLAAVAVQVELFRNDVNAITSTHVTAVEIGTVRFQSHLAWLVPPVFRPYTGSKIRTVIGTQRRRLTG